MKKRIILGLLGLALIAVEGNAYDLVPAAVSPGLADGVAVVPQSCPTFSWTSVSWALGYKVVVFEAAGLEVPAYERIVTQVSPVLVKDIPGKALSWTPSAAEQLANGGSYIWYVGAMMNATLGKWSEGRRFMVMEGPVWGMETKERVLKTLRENGISDAVAKKILQEMNSGYAGSIAASFDLTGGSQSGVQGSEGSYNTLYGLYAGGAITTGLYNSFFGRAAGSSNSSGSKNTFVGYSAGRRNTTASDNTFSGYAAGYYNTTGCQSVFLGSYAGYSNTSGTLNTFIGYTSGYKNTTGNYNTFIGHSAGVSNASGVGNTFLGWNAGNKCTIGFYNTFLGDASGSKNSNGCHNTVVGAFAGQENTAGSNNTMLGNEAGYSNKVGNGNVFLGYRSGTNETGSDKLYIANSETSSPLIYGDFSSSLLSFNGKVGIQTAPTTYKLEIYGGAYCDGGAWIDGSSREYKENIETLTSSEALQAFELLDPVKFNYKENKEEQYLGFIAEDVPDLVAMNDRKGLNPMDIVAMLTKVLQEQMSASRKQAKVLEEQQKTISSQQRALSSQGKELSELKEKISKLEKKHSKGDLSEIDKIQSELDIK